MDLFLTPDTYTPTVDEAGNYVDYVPKINAGLICPCACTRNKVYQTSSKFATHIKSKSHNLWIQRLNRDKSNYYAENLKMKKLVEDQQKIIQKLEIELSRKSMTINYLTEQLVFNNKTPKEEEEVSLMDIN